MGLPGVCYGLGIVVFFSRCNLSKPNWNKTVGVCQFCFLGLQQKYFSGDIFFVIRFPNTAPGAASMH